MTAPEFARIADGLYGFTRHAEPVYHSHGLDFAGTHRTFDGGILTACTCGWTGLAADASAGVDVWLAHRNAVLR